jgi:hypothetical protein
MTTIFMTFPPVVVDDVDDRPRARHAHPSDTPVGRLVFGPCGSSSGASGVPRVHEARIRSRKELRAALADAEEAAAPALPAFCTKKLLLCRAV